MIGVFQTISFLAAAAQGTVVVQGGSMTLDQAISVAERNAFSVRLQQSVIEKNHQRVNEARGNLGPQIGIGANYTRFGNAVTSKFGSNTVTVQPIDSKVATAVLNWPIDIAGNKSRLLRANEASRRSSEITLRASLNDTRLSVRQAYYGVLRAMAVIDVDQKALADAQGRLDQGQKQFDQQQVAKLDVTRYKAQVAQANSDLITAKDNLTLANYAFNLSLARPIETPVSLVDVTDLPGIGVGEDQLVGAAQTSRPEVLSALENLKALALITRATEATMNPTLNLQIQHTRTIDPTGLTATGQQTQGVLALSIPLFDSGVTRAKVNEAREDERQAKIGLEQTRLQISQEVRNAIANLASARARLENANEQVKLAQEVFRLAQVKQDAGAGTYYEVIDAETQLTQARNGQVSARYDYLTSYSQLQRAVGSDDVAGAVERAAKSPGGRK